MVDWPTLHNKKGFYIFSLLLAPFSYLYKSAVLVRIAIYKKRKKKFLPGFVVSVGNLTVGGTGKTPAACLLAEWALEMGYRPAILSKGYGGKNKKKILEVSDGKKIYAGPLEAGDEPYLMAKRLKNVPVVISQSRHEAGLLSHKKHDTNFFILDDGFQHLALARDLNLVLVDGSNPFGNGHLLPWGPLREPLQQIERSDAVIITRSNSNNVYENGKYLLEKMSGLKTLFRCDHLPDEVVFPLDGRIYEADFLSGKRVVAFAGIGNTDAFKNTLTDLGAEVIYFEKFLDHHYYIAEEIQTLHAKKEELEADILLTTEKDWVRIENADFLKKDMAYLKIRFSFLTDQNRFFELLTQRIEKTHSLK